MTNQKKKINLQGALKKASEDNAEPREIEIRVVQALNDEQILALKEIANDTNDSFKLNHKLLSGFQDRVMKIIDQWTQSLGPDNFRESIDALRQLCTETITQLKDRIDISEKYSLFKRRFWTVIMISSGVSIITTFLITSIYYKKKYGYLKDNEYLYKFELLQAPENSKLKKTREQYMLYDSSKNRIKTFVDEKQKQIDTDYNFYSK
ncbi:hypothetical protein [Fulvivirga lutea]|uniref:Uncharacterized protein n=1 Tax=Fulvivirga lutea TaxID=2810512 RepID=A0A974WNC5_9BACT|nr:hypothetical protein [Fulvivirga lutea]QSE98643.1 hypothetical protein JR347_06075 [Fulvivirga lutea]